SMASQADPIAPSTPPTPQRKILRGAVVRFVGDSGDGMQVTGDQFTSSSALAGNDLATFPDFPAEIRAPAGTTYGVSGFQINFSSPNVFTPGHDPDALVSRNPPSLKSILACLKSDRLLVVHSGAFTSHNLRKAGYAENPLADCSLEGRQVLSIDI